MSEGKLLSVKQLAKNELLLEKQEQCVSELKAKMSDLLSAKQVVKNLDREVKELEEKIQQEFDDINE